MAAQHLLYRGNLDLGEGPRQADLWISGSAAVAFEGAQQIGVLTAIRLGLTADRRLRLEGLDEQGQPAAWEGADPERIISRWGGATIAWPEGISWTRAEVVWSNYGVRVTAPGQTPRELIGAKAEAIGSQRWIVGPDGTRISASAQAGGCGCGGGR